MKRLRTLQDELLSWQQHNFPHRPSWQPLLGLQEELGELSHAYLKRAQKIRTTENHTENIKDAVGDIVVYLADFCNAEGIDLEEAIFETWARVKQRDWRACPATATSPTAPAPQKASP